MASDDFPAANARPHRSLEPGMPFFQLGHSGLAPPLSLDLSAAVPACDAIDLVHLTNRMGLHDVESRDSPAAMTASSTPTPYVTPSATPLSFASHLRRTIRAGPASELARLLTDISGAATRAAPVRTLWHALAHDGYACLLLTTCEPLPLAVAADAPVGSFVVALQSGAESNTTTFAVFSRISGAGTAGRGADLRQAAGAAIAAGYVVYSAALTRLHYALRDDDDVHSFHLRPTTMQFFQYAWKEEAVEEGEAGMLDVYADYTRLSHVACGSEGESNERVAMAAALLGLIKDRRCRVHFDEGAGLTANLDRVLHRANSATSVGAVVVELGAHLLCEAAAAALLCEKAGLRAVDEGGRAVSGLHVGDDDDAHQRVWTVMGSAAVVREVVARAVDRGATMDSGTDRSYVMA